MTQLNFESRLAPYRFHRYSLAVALVAIALGFALLDYFFTETLYTLYYQEQNASAAAV